MRGVLLLNGGTGSRLPAIALGVSIWRRSKTNPAQESA